MALACRRHRRDRLSAALGARVQLGRETAPAAPERFAHARNDVLTPENAGPTRTGGVLVDPHHRGVHEIGDVVVLKRGMTQIVAAGYVVERDGIHRGEGTKAWLRDFDGWDLPAWCYVDWHVPQRPFGTTGLTRATIQGINKAHLIDQADRIMAENQVTVVHEKEPEPTNPVTGDDLVRNLIQFGLRPGAAEDLAVALRRIRLLAAFYRDREWSLTKEHEARTFLVVPLLMALGWAEQRIQIEVPVPGVGRADIACFRRPVLTGAEECAIIIETKGLTQGLHYAPEQAHRYAHYFPTCEVVIVTNGYCYKAYQRGLDNDFSMLPAAYLNIMNPQDNYPLDPDHVKGAIEILRMLIPN